MTKYADFEGNALAEGATRKPVPTVAEARILSTNSCSRRHSPHAEVIADEKMASKKLRFDLVNSTAKRYIGRGIALYDLIKAGDLGYAHALENFEMEGGSRFSSYAARCIRRNIEWLILRQPAANPFSVDSKVLSLPAVVGPHIHRQLEISNAMPTLNASGRQVSGSAQRL